MSQVRPFRPCSIYVTWCIDCNVEMEGIEIPPLRCPSCETKRRAKECTYNHKTLQDKHESRTCPGCGITL